MQGARQWQGDRVVRLVLPVPEGDRRLPGPGLSLRGRGEEESQLLSRRTASRQTSVGTIWCQRTASRRAIDGRGRQKAPPGRKGGAVVESWPRQTRVQPTTAETSWIAMATNETRWGRKTVLSHYLIRWGIEVLFKMSKQYLGLGDYQVLRYRAVERYLHLVLIAYLLLTHLGVFQPDAQADRQNDDKPLRLPSIPKLLNNYFWN